jgi:hypothetical protein
MIRCPVASSSIASAATWPMSSVDTVENARSTGATKLGRMPSVTADCAVQAQFSMKNAARTNVTDGAAPRRPSSN